MKIDKEYPATHSMSTAWYAVDKDGCVAILDFNEEGPQPDGIGAPYDHGMDSMLIDDLAEYDQEDVKVLPYTKEQVEDLLYMEMTPLEKIDMFDYNIVLKISDDRVEEFIDRLQKLESHTIIRLSSEMSLFCVSGAPFEKFDKEMGKIVADNIIVGGYIYDYYESENWNEKQHQLPLFVFEQPYWYKEPMERVSNPKHPFTYDQLPDLIKRKVINLPISFKDTDKLQIAEYSQFQMHGYFTTVYKGRYYHKLPLSNGIMKYICSSVLPIEASIRCELCGKCRNSKYVEDFRNIQCADYPTVLIIEFFNKHTHTVEHDYDLETELFYRNSYVINLIHGYPSVDNCKLAPYNKEVAKERFSNCHSYLETAVNILLPRVVIIQDNALDILRDIYKIELDHHIIEICGIHMPFYLMSEVKKYKDTIEELSSQPYLGKKLTMEEKIVDVETIDGDFQKINLSIENIISQFPGFLVKEGSDHIDCEDVYSAVNLLKYVYYNKGKFDNRLTDTQYQYILKAEDILNNCDCKDCQSVKDVKYTADYILYSMLHIKD